LREEAYGAWVLCLYRGHEWNSTSKRKRAAAGAKREIASSIGLISRKFEKWKKAEFHNRSILHFFSLFRAL
jgi:hypothetical protein